MATAGVELIAAERERQIVEEGRTPEHDDAHVAGELAQAGGAYAIQAPGWWPWEQRPVMTRTATSLDDAPTWRMNRRRELAKAGALIAAEIDRLTRLET
jgi:hypothetical protein